MKTLTNTGRRRLGIPGRPALILNPNQGEPVTDEQIETFCKNRTVVRWLDSGVLKLTDGTEEVEVEHVKVAPKPQRRSGLRKQLKRDARTPVKLPEGVEGEGVEKHHAGGGWWNVYVNGFQVTDRKVRKDEAESIAAEYE